MIKKIFGYIMIVFLFVGSICGIVYGIKYQEVNSQLKENYEYIQEINDLKSELKIIDNKHTEILLKWDAEKKENEQNKQNLQQVNLQLDEKNSRIEELEDLVAEDNQTIVDLQKQIQSLENEKTETEEDNAQKQARIQELQTQVSTLELSVSEKTEAISNLNQQIVTLNEEKNNLNTIILEKEQLIETLQSEKLTLQNEVTRLSGLIVGYEEIKNGTHEVNFYNGDVLIKTLVVKNGGNIDSIEDPVREGRKFLGWIDSEGNSIDFSSYIINQDMNFYADFSKPLSEYTWKEIDEISAKGEAQEYFSVGEEKAFSSGYYEADTEYTAVILGFEHDDLANGSGKAKISFGLKKVTSSSTEMFTTVKTNGHWNDGDLYKYFNKLFNNSPSDLKNAVKLTTKKCISPGGGSYTTNSNFWLLSVAEIYSEDSITNTIHSLFRQEVVKNAVKKEGSQYDYYKNLIGDADLNTANQYLVEMFSATYRSGFYLRTGVFGHSSNYCCISKEGKVSSASQNSSYYFNFGFCI